MIIFQGLWRMICSGQYPGRRIHWMGQIFWPWLCVWISICFPNRDDDIYIEIPERKFPYRIIWMNSISEVSIKSIHIIIIINYDVLIWFWCIRWEMSKYIAGWARSYDDDGNSSLWDTMCSLAGQWLWVPKMPTKSTCSMHLLELEVCPRFRTSELFRMNLYRRYLDRMHQRKFPIYCCFGA